MIWRVEVKHKSGIFNPEQSSGDDPFAEGVQKDILDLGIEGISKVHVAILYHLQGKISDSDIDRISREL